MPVTVSRWVVFAALLVEPIIALASGGEAHGDEHHGMPTAVKLGVMTVNLVIFLVVLRKAAWPMMVEWVSTRRDGVVSALEQAAVAKRDAESLKAQWKDRLASLDQEIDEMRAQARKQIDSEREQILESARKLAESIRRDAESAAQQQLRNAQDELRAEVARRAFQIAAEAAPSQLGDAQQKRFVDEFITEVGK